MSRRQWLVAAFTVLPGAAWAQPDLPSASVAEAFAAAQDGRMVIVDIRRPEEWAETGVARGAVKLDMTAADFPQRLMALRQASGNREIGIICRTANRTDYVQKALARHNIRLVNIRGGMAGNPGNPGWIASGLPIEK
ncbi:MAG TPA: rhodanese-like domain-containing protein [Beijerinckiaceae bacterium]|nr:rhodanese-like domain-containing protein [Beijerinckiaceae bacterium]